MLYILCGLPFSGKTTFANKLKEKFGFTVIGTDEVKKMYGYTGNHYTWIPEVTWQEILQKTYTYIIDALKQNQSVVFDYTNHFKKERKQIRQLATAIGIKTQTIWVDVDPTITKKRYLQNKQTHNRHDIAEEFFQWAHTVFEPPTNNEHVMVYNGRQNIDEWILENNLP